MRFGSRVVFEEILSKEGGTGDVQRGQSLIVWAIADGGGCARSVDAYLMRGAS